MFWPILGSAVKVAQSVSSAVPNNVTELTPPAWAPPRWLSVRTVDIRGGRAASGVVGSRGAFYLSPDLERTDAASDL